MEGVASPGQAMPELFSCERIRARLTPGACGRMYRSAEDRPPRDGEARAACVGCLIGARNAGRDLEEALRAQRVRELAGICVACGATGRRMVAGLRCVSCYNRAREVQRGRDARGREPRFATRYHAVSLVVATPTGVALARDFGGVTGRAEAMLLAAKQRPGDALAIGFHRLSPLPPGATLDLAPDFAPRRGRRRRARPALILPASAGLFVPQLELALAHGR